MVGSPKFILARISKGSSYYCVMCTHVCGTDKVCILKVKTVDNMKDGNDKGKGMESKLETRRSNIYLVH